MAKAKRLSAKFVAYSALMTALVYVGTLIGFSGGQFYFNFGDAVIMVCAYLLGPIPAAIAGGIGAFLGDLTVYPATMVYTLFIKAIEGLIAGLLFLLVKRLSSRYFATRLTDEMKAFMQATASRASHSYALPNNAPSSFSSAEELSCDNAAADLSPSDPFPSSDIPATPSSTSDAPAYPSFTSDAPDDISDSPQNPTPTSDAPAYPSFTSDAPADISDSPQNPESTPQSIPKNAVFENITSLKRRLFALKISLSLIVCLFSGALMMVGYFICQTFLYGTYAAALVALPLDAVQASVSAAIATGAIGMFNKDLLKLRP